jgi:transposase InsO family protein
MLEKPRDKLKLRRWCVRKHLDGEDIENIRLTAKVSRRTLYYWLERFQQNGGEGLRDTSRRPHTIHRLNPSVVEKVIQLRQQHGWCGQAISAHLRRESVEVSNGSVYKILHNHSLPIKTYAPRIKRTYIRFQRAHPDSLWQTDIKYYGDRYLIAFIDDCSRYVPAASLNPESSTDTVLETLQEALSNGRTPKQILSDHGTQSWSNDGPGRFTDFCIQHGIEHIFGSTGKPTTQGKIERFWQTFELYYPRFNNMTEFLEHYNYVRPHRSLNFLTPAEIYYS